MNCKYIFEIHIHMDNEEMENDYKEFSVEVVSKTRLFCEKLLKVMADLKIYFWYTSTDDMIIMNPSRVTKDIRQMSLFFTRVKEINKNNRFTVQIKLIIEFNEEVE